MESQNEDCGFITCIGCPFQRKCYPKEEIISNSPKTQPHEKVS